MGAATLLLIRVVLARAFVLWALVRLVFAALPLAAGGRPGSMPVPPLGIILLAAGIGMIDVRVRGERILWANLGVTPAALAAVYAAAALVAEFVLSMVAR